MKKNHLLTHCRFLMLSDYEDDDVDTQPVVLNEVDVRIKDNDHCERLLQAADYNEDVTKKVLLCASGEIEGGKDACQVINFSTCKEKLVKKYVHFRGIVEDHWLFKEMMASLFLLVSLVGA